MKRYQKLIAVSRHEYLTVIKQPSFWVSLLLVPAIIIIAFGISYVSNKDVGKIEKKTNKDGYTIKVVDQSGLISKQLVASAKLEMTQTANTDALVADVSKNKLDAVIIYPKNITDTKSYKVYVSDDKEDSEKASNISDLGDYLLRQSILEPLASPKVINLALEGASAETTTYQDGKEQVGFATYVVPGAFLLLFYIALFMSISYAMTSVSEEKENRAIEMVLSYVRPRTLMTGKLIGTSLVTLTQFLFYVAIGITAYLVARALGNDLQLPFDINNLVFEFQPIFFGLAYFVTGFLLYISLMLATGAAFPSSKEAAGFTTIFYLMPFVPFWAFEIIRTQSDSFLTQFSSFFPLTAPSTLLLRNTFGTLNLGEALLGLAILIVSTIAAVWLAGRLFKLGALEFNSRVQLSKVFSRK